MQAIHHAAISGYAEIMTSLIDHFGVDPQAKADVRAHGSLLAFFGTRLKKEYCLCYRKTYSHCTMLHWLVSWK